MITHLFCNALLKIILISNVDFSCTKQFRQFTKRKDRYSLMPNKAFPLLIIPLFHSTLITIKYLSKIQVLYFHMFRQSNLYQEMHFAPHNKFPEAAHKHDMPQDSMIPFLALDS